MAKPVTVEAAEVSRPAPPYLGQHLRGVDHGRVILPVEWRLEGSPRDLMVIVWPLLTREYLLVLSPARWEVLQKNLEELSLADEQGAKLERLLASSTSMRTLDNYGRLPLPEEAARSLGIESEAMLVGRISKFEIWGPTRYAATLAPLDTQLIANALRTIKI